MASTGICLDVAIDHRIRQLLKPGLNPKLNPNRPDGEHVEKLRQLHPLGRSNQDEASPELQVTKKLAEPLSQGGLAVALERPADHHPFSDGVDVVIEESPTLRALRDVFELFGLDLVKDVTVLDSLPFLPKKEKPKRFGYAMRKYVTTRRKHHKAFLEAMVAKHPDVVLCMWKRESKSEDIWIGKEFEHEGVGKCFKNEKVTLRDHHGYSTEAQRVSAFHPGYCMNRQTAYSQFRQLLMLEIAHGYHLLGGSWHEEPWMAELRESCKEQTMQLVNAKNRGSEPELHVLYDQALTKIQALIPELAMSKGPHDERPKLLYNKLVAAKWTECMNDASLCLKAAAAQRPQQDLVSVHSTIDPQEDMAIRTREFVISIATIIGREEMELRIGQGNGVLSERYVKHLQDQRKCFINPKDPKQDAPWYGNGYLKRGMMDFLLGLNDAFSDGWFTRRIRGPIGLQMSLVNASKTFLTMACDMEALLSTLAGEWKEGVAGDHSDDEVVESLGRLALSQHND